ncbi:hypothetical protein JMA_10230 [Jeotgalibacillus malaysiensis]|uniref:DUF1541 domain-containing protein n=1 Tax=Jeotgalibacillus malaysiensis TaxID=1508404 RepID=A0A0B5AJ32_9BACL|nr:YdhK family protein [Jeotgalibacillus malaysiensis]AJD90340.1 hypothetical protein JMA_10230 [Jeotgalibacillus malaysiensis]
MKKYSYLTAASVMSAVVVMSGCAGTEESTENEIVETAEDGSSTPQPNEAFSDIDVSGDGEIPDGLETAEDPAFAEGDTVTINASHFGGMEGAEGTIVGAYTSNAYSISYEPSDGGDMVEDYQWIIDEETRAGALETPYAEGDEVEITTDRVEGMFGVMVEIQSVQEDATIYMVDFSLTDSEDTVLNYKWLAEDELSAD